MRNNLLFTVARMHLKGGVKVDMFTGSDLKELRAKKNGQQKHSLNGYRVTGQRYSGMKAVS